MMRKRVFYLFIVFWGCLELSLWGVGVRVATYNVKNYARVDRWVDSHYRKEYPKPEKEKEALRAIISAHDPDILAIQEMGGEDYLEELRRDLSEEGLEYPYTALAEGADADRHVGVLSREPFKEVRVHRDLKFKYFDEEKEVKRGLLEVIYETEGVEWHLFVVHLKSKLTVNKEDPESEIRRVGEAKVIRDRIRKLFKGEAKGYYMVAGDFNDRPNSKALARFLRSGKETLSMIVAAKDSRKEVWTQYYRAGGVYTQMDYLLVSHDLGEVLKEVEGVIVDTTNAGVASDHRMVYADLVFDDVF